MGNGKKDRKKRKHRASPIKSQIAIRLEKLRNRRRHNLWSDDDNDNNNNNNNHVENSNIIVLSDSDDEQSSHKQKSRSHTLKTATCLICSILSNLSSKNCCTEHLSYLKQHSHRLSKQQTILSNTDENIQQNHQTSPMIIEPPSPPRSPLPPLASTIVIESAKRTSLEHPPTTIEQNTSTLIDDTSFQTTSNIRLHNPWTPSSDEIVIALEKVVDANDTSNDKPLEYTPTTARRTKTDIMAAHLPKIPLKPGRFRQGRPIIDRSINTNAANEYRPLASSTQSSSNIRSSSPICNIANRNDNVFTQDEPIEPSTTIETNENNPHTTNERTPSRVSFRLNPDGTRVSISRPPLPTNANSPLLNSLRRTSTDVTPLSKPM